MAATVNCIVTFEAVINGKLKDGGTGLYAPFTISTSADTASEFDVAVTAASGGQQIASIGTTPVLIYVNPLVAGILSWRGTTDADNGSISLPANSHFLIPGGSTTADAATPELRSEAASQAITQLWFDAGTDGKVLGMILT